MPIDKDPTASTMAELKEQMRRLESIVERQQIQLEEQRLALVAAVGGGNGTTGNRAGDDLRGAAESGSVADADDAEQTDRRQLLRRAGTVAAGAIVGTAALAVGTATPAAAANGGNMILGAVNDAAATTVLQGRLQVLTTLSQGIYGYSTASSGMGVRGAAAGTDGIGVFAQSTNGPGLQISNGTQVIPPQAGTWQTGAFLVAGSHLHYCYYGGVGPASKWARLSGTFVPFDASIRVYDSRPGTMPATLPKTKFIDHEERTLSLTVNNAIPAGVAPSAVMVNLTATNTNPGGYFSAWRSTIPWPGTSSLNWSSANQTIANQSTIKINGLNQIKVRCEGDGGADLIVDVVGYYL